MENNITVIAQRWKQTRNDLPKKVSVIMLQFTSQRFDDQAWLDGTPMPWQKRAKNKDAGRALLILSGNLRRGNRVVSITDTSVTLGNDMPYAKAHNNGFTGVVTIQAHTRKRFEKQKVADNTRLKKNGEPRVRTLMKQTGEIQVKSYTMNMNIPQRKFMGDSVVLRQMIRQLITDEVNKCFKS